MHFDASDESIKMMMDLISSVNDICIEFGICDHLRKITYIDLERQRNTASVVLTPRILETLNLLRQHVAETFSSYACKAEANLSARTLSFEHVWHADSERLTAEGNLQLVPNQKTTQEVVERINSTV